MPFCYFFCVFCNTFVLIAYITVSMWLVVFLYYNYFNIKYFNSLLIPFYVYSITTFFVVTIGITFKILKL